jgi:hypothetical protein
MQDFIALIKQLWNKISTFVRNVCSALKERILSIVSGIKRLLGISVDERAFEKALDHTTCGLSKKDVDAFFKICTTRYKDVVGIVDELAGAKDIRNCYNNNKSLFELLGVTISDHTNNDEIVFGLADLGESKTFRQHGFVGGSKTVLAALYDYNKDLGHLASEVSSADVEIERAAKVVISRTQRMKFENESAESERNHKLELEKRILGRVSIFIRRFFEYYNAVTVVVHTLSKLTHDNIDAVASLDAKMFGGYVHRAQALDNASDDPLSVNGKMIQRLPENESQIERIIVAISKPCLEGTVVYDKDGIRLDILGHHFSLVIRHEQTDVVGRHGGVLCYGRNGSPLKIQEGDGYKFVRLDSVDRLIRSAEKFAASAGLSFSPATISKVRMVLGF